MRRAAAALALCAVTCWLAGCGVRPSGVVVAGDPVKRDNPAIEVYFVQDGKVVPVARSAPNGLDPAVAMAELALGPRDTERAAGVTTELPGELTIGPFAAETGRPVLVIRFAPDKLSELARAQLACTARAAITGSYGGHFELTVEGPGGSTVLAICS